MDQPLADRSRLEKLLIRGSERRPAKRPTPTVAVVLYVEETGATEGSVEKEMKRGRDCSSRDGKTWGGSLYDEPNRLRYDYQREMLLILGITLI